MSTHASSHGSAPEPRYTVEQLFARLNAQYGSQAVGAMFAAADMRVVKAEWRRHVLDRPTAIVDAALDRLLAEQRSFPPSLAEFRAAMHAVTPRKPKDPALVAPPATPEQRARNRELAQQLVAQLGSRLNRPRPTMHRGVPVEREPGSDDEPVQAAADVACRCWNGRVRAETLCEACATFAGVRVRAQWLREGVES